MKNISNIASIKQFFIWMSLIASNTLASLALVSLLPIDALASHVGYHYEYLDHRHGLPQNSVRSVVSDRGGYLWVATEKGLSRYDGSRFTNFSVLIDDIPEDVSMGMAVDSQDRIWTSWYTHSLRVLSSDRSQVMSFEPPAGFPDDLITRYAPRIIEMQNGDIWFPGVRHAYQLDQNNQVKTIDIGDTLGSAFALINNTIISSVADGLALIDPVSHELKTVTTPLSNLHELDHRLKAPIKLHGNDQHIIYCSRMGVFKHEWATGETSLLLENRDAAIIGCLEHETRLLIGLIEPSSNTAIIKSLDIASAEFVPNHPGLPGAVDYDDGYGHFEMFVDDDDARWLAIGQFYYRAIDADDMFERIDFPRKAYDIGKVFSRGGAGVIWSRTDGQGLIKISRYSKRFETITPPTGMTLSKRIRSMAVDKNDNVWMVSADQDLLFWDRGSDTWHHMLSIKPGIIKFLEILPDQTVWTILPNEQKLVGYDPDEQAWRYEYPLKLPSAVISQSRDGRLLVGSEHSVYLVSSRTGQMQRVSNTKIHGQMRDLLEDAYGNIWVGTHEAGLARVDPQGNVRYWHPGNSNLGSDKIFSLHLATNQSLWIGTWHGGLYRLDIPTMEFTHFGVREGLPDSTVFGILGDEAGALWLSTYAGLVKFMPCTVPGCQPETTVFTRRDGLQGAEFDANSHFRSRKGELFFSGAGGMNAFFPGDIVINSEAPEIRVSRAQLNKGLIPGASSEFSFPSEVRLPFNFDEIRLELSVLDFNQPEKNRFQFRELEGDGSWVDLQQPYLTLRKLSDGSHQYEFRGANNDGTWSARPASISLKVAPPAFRHPLMLTLYLLAAILIPVTFLRHKQKRLIREKLRLEEKVDERTAELELATKSRERFFANISHDISSPVHMILLMLENRLETARTEDRKVYKSATGYAAQLMVYLNQLVREARTHELDSRRYAADISTLIQQLVSTNEAVANSRSIKVELAELPHDRVVFYASSSISIFSNLLCNALVYTPEGGTISIKGKVRDNFYLVSISNPVSNNLDADFNRYLKRGNRGLDVNKGPEGHGLGLSIVISNLKMLNGSLEVEQPEENTISFRVTLPIAPEELPVLNIEQDFAFSYEQMLSIKHLTQDDGTAENHRNGNQTSRVSIMIVEDDDKGAKLLAHALSEQFDVSIEGSCEAALKSLERQQPDVILCDLFLPGESGLELLRKVRSNRMSMDTFFVLMTADISEEHRLSTQKLKADRFIRKPVSAETLRLLIGNHFELYAQRQQRQRERELLLKARLDSLKDETISFRQRFGQALDEMYPDPNTTIESFQSRLAMGYYQLVKHCKRDFGHSPKRLLIQKRVEAASELLKATDCSIALVAELCGFSSHSQFSIVFKKEIGTSPAAYRKSQ